MRRIHFQAFIQASCMLVLSRANVVYVTDLQIFTYLAPCAASAISYNVQSQTYEACPEATDALQSCVCSKGNNFAALTSKVSSSIRANCGATATDDQASASTVLSAYCNQNSLPTFPTPATPVSQYITDIPEISYLAPCASSYISYAVMGLTGSFCPSEAPALATCACQKRSLAVSQTINSSVKSACSPVTAEISSAQAFFAAYCAMNSGTSAFPTLSNPPGDMSYYITDLPQFSSMAPCAQSGLSYGVFTNTYDLCPQGPQALASCACIKDGMSGYVASIITSSVKYRCSSDSSDMSSALAVFDVYCSAARAQVTPAGVTASVQQTTHAGAPGGSGGAPGAQPTSGGSAGLNSGTNGGTGQPGGGSKTGLYAGIAVGVVVGLALIGVAIVFVMRNARKKRNLPPPIQPFNNEDLGGGTSELAGKPIAAAAVPPPSPSPSMIKNSHSPIMNSVSPVSAHNSMFPPPGTPELHGNNGKPPMPTYNNMFPPPNRPELQGHAYSHNGTPPPGHAELQGPMYGNAPPNRPELYGQAYSGQSPYQGPYGQQIHEFPAQQPVYQADSRPVPPRSGLPDMGWHSGPVHSYAELDGGYTRDQQPHAR